MAVVKGSLEETKVESESPEFNDTNEVRSTYFPSKRILSSSPSSSHDDRPNVLKVGSNNRSVGASVTPKVKQEIHVPCLADLEKNGVYDREGILHYLANLARSENREYIHDVIRLNTGFATSETKVPNDASKIEADDMLTAEDRHYRLVDELRETLKAVPDSLLHLTTGWVRPGDCGRPADQKPDWLDTDKLKRGQKFAQDYMFSTLYTSIVGLIPVFSFDDELKPLIITGRSRRPYTAFKRYLSTGLKFRRWYTQDIWNKETTAWKDMSVARAMHSATRKRLAGTTNEEIDAATAIPNAYCPTRDVMMKDFVNACEAPVVGQCPFVAGHNNPNRPKGISQAAMAITQWSFAGLLVSYPQRFGVHHATDEDLEAFCHLWRILGYQLGIEDEYNFYRGTLEDVRQRGRELLDTWIKPNLRVITLEWEHMSRSLIIGLAVAILPCLTFEMVVVHLMETLEVPMPKLYASFSYVDRLVYNLMTGLFHYAMKAPGVTSLVNAFVNMSINQAEKFTPDQLAALRIKLGE